MYVVTVAFELKSGATDAFLPLMIENARRSLLEEAGCRHFDVCADPADPRAIFLYEVYDDRAAFDAHLASAHFQAFDAATASMIKSKAVRVFERIEP